MSISSLGIGSNILTQDVLDQLREVDEAAQINPITLKIANENDKKAAMDLIDASMKNFIDSVNEIKSQSLYDERKAEVTGTAVTITAAPNTDIQDFTIAVTTLATKQIEQSGQFSAESDLVATAAGSMNLNIDGVDFTINYDATTTLKDLKNLINDVAGNKVDATILNIGSGDARLIISSVDTGTTQNITITDTSGFLSDDGGATAGGTLLTTGLTQVQAGVDSEFTFNGQAITRTTNDISDLITGLTINLKEVGTSTVSITQDRENIESKFDSFVSKYNETMKELNSMTKSSVESDERGIFSAESTIKNMKRTIEDMIGSVGGGVGTLVDYGFDVDKDGIMTLDKTVLNAELDTNSANVEAFFSGGTYVNADLSTTVLTGAFTEISTIVEAYTKYDATLDQFSNSITENISSLEDRKQSAIERLDTKYEILKKQYTAYDLMINKFNSASQMFIQLANTQTASQNQ